MSDILIFTKSGSTITWAPGTHLHQAVMCHLKGDTLGMDDHMNLAFRANNVRESHVVDQKLRSVRSEKKESHDEKINRSQD